MKLLITGAGGFIGSHLAEAAIRAGHAVRALVRYNSRGSCGFLDALRPEIRNELDVLLADVCDQEAMHTAVRGIDGVVHLAALIGIPYSYLAPSSYVAVNVQGTLNLLNAARRSECKVFVHTSTSEVYGTAQRVPIDESHPLVGQSPYSASKIGADKLAESYALSFSMPVLTIRPFNTYGPRQSMRAVIPTLVAQLLDDRVSCVRAGNLEPIRDFTYVTDTVNGFLRALDSSPVPNGETINLGSGEGYSIASILASLQSIVGVSKPLVQDEVRFRPERSEVLRLIADNSKARRMLRWKPTVSLEDGLSAVAEYVRAHRVQETSRYYI